MRTVVSVTNSVELPSAWGRLATSSKPPLPCCLPYSAAAVTAAAIAPAEVPPMFLKEYVFDNSTTAAGYTTPLVMPPFITMSQYLDGEELTGVFMKNLDVGVGLQT